MSRIQLQNVTKQYGNGVVAVRKLSLDVADQELLVLVGPSGCGKTTALRMVAGLEEISEGDVFIGGRKVTDVPERERDIAMVFQNYALYPHMTVAQNIGFGLKMAKRPKSEIAQRVKDAAQLLALDNLLDRRPKQLSGGQRQRVAMGRAIVREPQAFLMDEPLSNLDAQLRVQMRGEIQALQKRLGVTTIYVTHDQVEAMTMGDRIAVMRDGVLQQVDTPLEVYRHPANVFVAGFIGSPPMNLAGGTVERNGNTTTIHLGSTALVVPEPVARKLGAVPNGRSVIVGIRPEDIYPAAERNGTSLTLPARIDRVEALGSSVLGFFSLDTPVLHMSGLDAAIGRETIEDVAFVGAAGQTSLCASFDGHTDIREGDKLEVAVEPELLHFFDPASEAEIGF